MVDRISKNDISTCILLEKNDSRLSSIHFNLNNNTVILYGEALQNNTVVDYIRIRGSAATNHNYNTNEFVTVDDDQIHDGTFDEDAFDQLLEFIGKSRSLTRLDLHGIPMVMIMDKFLDAASRSDSIVHIRLIRCHVNIGTFRDFFYKLNYNMKLWTEDISFHHDSSDRCIVNLHETEKPISIQTLSLYGINNNSKNTVIDLCQHNINVNILRVGDDTFAASQHTYIETSLADNIRLFLSRSSTLHCLELLTVKFDSKSSFWLLCEGIISCCSLETISLDNCDLSSEEMTRLFQVLFHQQVSTIKVLKIAGRTRFNMPVSTVVSGILSRKKKFSQLSTIELDISQNPPLPDYPILDISILLKPLTEDATLSCLYLGSLTNKNQIDDLIGCIPKLRGLNRIQFDTGTSNFRDQKQLDALIGSLKSNWSLEEIDCFVDAYHAYYDDNGLNDGAVTRLFSYKHRNICMHTFIQDPTSINIPNSLLPIMLAHVIDYEFCYEILFRILLQHNFVPNP